MPDQDTSSVGPHAATSSEAVQVAEEFRHKLSEKLQNSILELIERCKEYVDLKKMRPSE
jgi:hypothetical protein